MEPQIPRLRQVLGLWAPGLPSLPAEGEGQDRTIEYVRGNPEPGLRFSSLADLNRQVWAWMGEVNHQPHSTTRGIPSERLVQENLRLISSQPDYKTSYVAYQQVAKDCLFSCRGNRYSVADQYAGKTVVVKEPVAGGWIRICFQQATVAEHRLDSGKGAMVIRDEHYLDLVRCPRGRPPCPPPSRELVAGPGVVCHFTVPEAEVRPLTVYEEVSQVAAI